MCRSPRLCRGPRRPAPRAGGRTHRLEATPATVAYGYYWSEAKPVLRIASGDIIDVDTLLTNNPTGLQRAGVPPEKIQESLKAIVTEVTGDRRGPGGHILTGPVYVEGAEPGDVLEVKILSIDFAIDYGYNGCAGFIPENCDRSVGLRIMAIDRKTMTSEYAPGIVIPLRPFFGSMGVAPAPELGRVSSNPPGKHAGNLDNKELVAGTTLFIPGLRARRAVRSRRRPWRAGRRRGGSDGDRDVAARPPAAHRPQGHEAHVAARRDRHRFHQHGDRSRPRGGDQGRDPGDGGFPRGGEEADEAPGVSGGQHRRQRRRHAARRQAEPRRAREDAEEHLQVGGADVCGDTTALY